MAQHEHDEGTDPLYLQSSWLAATFVVCKQFGPRSGPTECPNRLTPIEFLKDFFLKKKRLFFFWGGGE